MYRLILVFSFIFTILLGSCQENNSSQTIDKDLHTAFKEMVIENNSIGAAAAYSINGETEWISTQGYSDQNNNVSFDEGTKVRMASIAKSMTALAIMQLVEKELIDLDLPIQTYIPEYPKQSTTQITTRHLLSHTSGIAGYANGKEAETQIYYPTLSDAIVLFEDRPLLFEPGTQYNYTTYGYTVLGLIIEKVSNLSYEAYMKQNIWDKAEMTNTGVDIFKVTEEKSSLFYSKTKRGKLKVGKENNLSGRVPGGGLYTTVGDMLKFGNAVINNVFVKEETLTMMRQQHSLNKEVRYGFGWFLHSPKPNVGEIIGHAGGQTGCSSQLFIVPEKGIVSIVLSNTSRADRVTEFGAHLIKIANQQIESNNSLK